MNEFTTLLQQGNAWFFIPSAILLGVLHGLEPGHSKTMMAAFIIAINGTVRQAVMLGLAATASHTIIVWLIAFGGMYVSNKFTAESAEPWLQLFSAALILSTALWMIWRTRKEEKSWLEGMRGHDDSQIIDIGNGKIELSVIEDEHGARFHIRRIKGPFWSSQEMCVVIDRGNGQSEIYQFIDKGRSAESENVIPEPHEFAVTLKLGSNTHSHEFQTHFHEHHHQETDGIEKGSPDYQDAHELAHENEIKRRFDGKEISNWQILLFGLTGGLIPCPAAITVLLICIQLKALTLGATLVVCFSIGLALTLVTVGVCAAVSVRQMAKRWSGFGAIVKKAPYFSSVLIGCVGIYMGIHGYLAIVS
jgi:nickel/cobalt exporter